MSVALFAPPQRLFAQFEELKTQWQSETEHLSSPTEIALHPAYQRIIGLGPQAIPTFSMTSTVTRINGFGR